MVMSDGLPGMARPMTAFPRVAFAINRHQVEWPTLLRSEGQGRQANHRGAVMKPASIKPFRCANLHRVSTEHGLDQEFNSLDAQDEVTRRFIPRKCLRYLTCNPILPSDLL